MSTPTAAAAPVSPPAAAALTLRLRALHAPKDGNTEHEYEDAYAVQKLAPVGTADGAAAGPPTTFTVAVSDGASSSVFAREWARLLVGAFAAGPFPAASEANARVARLGQTWRDQVKSGPSALPWYAEEKLTQGSHASLLVVTWDLTGARTFSARALGDSCLFVVRRGRLKHAFPVTRAADFGNHPHLLGTELGTAARAEHAPTFLALDRSYEPGDRFLLMTDALAHWFLAEHEAGRKPWDALPAEQSKLAPWLDARRANGSLKNDDVTLLALNVLPAVAG